MSTLPKSIQNLITQLSRLPGVGPKTAQRLTFYLLKQPSIDVDAFAQALSNLQKNIIYCSVCFNMAETNPCKICADTHRNQNVICVLEDPMDVVAMDQLSDFPGVFHVLGGVISPLEGVSAENLTIRKLLERVRNPNSPKEIILATNPSLEGEATAMYISKLLKNPEYAHVKVTRIGRGLPMGADLEYADEFTLSKAMEGRQEF
ncbi:MAG TPA: recombination mediator RecR [Patescibacteria group bacterium]|nr:recombination mediator RecR [Patescibacteria group bacterium]